MTRTVTRADGTVIVDLSYFGRYTVDEKAGTLTHHVEGSLFPEDLGSDWVRPFTLEGDRLTLRLTGEDGLTRTLVLQRRR